MKKHLSNLFAGLLVLVVFLAHSLTIRSAETLKNGRWSDTLSWDTNAIPGELTTTLIKHRINLSGTVKTGNIVVAPGCELHFSGSDGVVRLDCGSITVMPGGTVSADSTLSGLYLNSGDIIVQKTVSDTGTFISNCGGLNMSCGSILNEGVLKLLTSNYMTVNGDITNNGLFVYTGNGIQLYGHKMIQENPAALWEVAGIMYQMNWSHPQYLGTDTVPLSIGGKIKLKGTRFYSYGSRLRPLTFAAGMSFDGGYFAGVKADSLIVEGKNQFYIGSSILSDCVTEGIIDCSSMTMLGKTSMNGTIQSRGSSPLILSGEATLNGILREQPNEALTVSFCGSFTNNGFIDLQTAGIYGYGNPQFINNSEIKAHGITLLSGFLNDVLTKRNDGPKIFENNGLIEAFVSVDTTYTVLSRSVGTWSGSLYSGIQSGFRSILKGSHQFTQCNVQNVGSEMDDVITMTRSQLTDFKGQATKIFMKSGCRITNVDNCDMTAYGALEINGKNSGTLLAKDSLIYAGTFTGHLVTNGQVLAKQYNSSLRSEGVWINNGTLVNQNRNEGISIGGTFINNGTVNIYTIVDGLKGRIFQNGTWASELTYNLNAQANCMLWMVKPTNINYAIRMSPQGGFNSTVSQIYTKNNRPVSTFFHASVSVADTGTYKVKDPAPFTAKASNYITYHNPFGFTTPLATDSTIRESVTYRWNKIPGSTGYKIRLMSKVDGREYTFGVDSVMNGDTTLVFGKLGSKVYDAYFSVQFGYENHYTWSHESGSHLLNLTGVALPKTVDANKLQAGDIAIVQVNKYNQSFDFVTLKKIKAGAIIYFTDYSYSKALSDFDKSTTLDGVYTFTAPTDLAAGTVVQSLNNSNFDKSTISFDSRSVGSYLKGETLIAYQIAEGADTTFLTAFGWLRQNCFIKGNTSSTVSDVPPGLSFENRTVVQMDSIPYGNHKYSKYDGFTGTAQTLREWLSNPANYYSSIGNPGNSAVGTFTVLNPDNTAPVLRRSYPSSTMTNVSLNTDGELVFNEKVNIQKGLRLKNTSSEGGMITIFRDVNANEMFVLDDSTVVFPMEGFLRSSGNYSIIVPEGFVTDESNNPWPASGSLTIPFATGVSKRNIVLDFDSVSTESSKWTTITTQSGEMGSTYLGYASFKMKGIPMTYYATLNDTSIFTKDTIVGKRRISGFGFKSRLVVDLRGLNTNVRAIQSQLNSNNGLLCTKVYTGGSCIDNRSIYNTSGSKNRFEMNPEYSIGYIKQHFENEADVKLDSVIYEGLEGIVFKITLETSELVTSTEGCNVAKPRMILYPNPVSGTATMTFLSKTTGQAVIQICDITGKTLAVHNEPVTEGINSIALDVQHLSGVYILRVNTPGETFIEKMVVK